MTTKKRMRVRLNLSFHLDEFESPDTGEVKLDGEAWEALRRTRIVIGEPFYITSGYRTPEHNEKTVGSHTNSGHLYGTAFDLIVHAVKPDDLLKEARRNGFTHVKYYPSTQHYHLEVRHDAEQPEEDSDPGHEESRSKPVDGSGQSREDGDDVQGQESGTVRGVQSDCTGTGGHEESSRDSD